jgi:hypothetical protein
MRSDEELPKSASAQWEASLANAKLRKQILNR